MAGFINALFLMFVGFFIFSEAVEVCQSFITLNNVVLLVLLGFLLDNNQCSESTPKQTAILFNPFYVGGCLLL